MPVVIKAAAPAKPFTMADMKDGQIAVRDNGDIVQCFDSTAYGANKKHWVNLGRFSGASWSVAKDEVGLDLKVTLLEKGATIIVQ